MNAPGVLYRLLLHCFPPDFRRTHGDDFLRALQDQRTEARYRAPLIGAVAFWSVAIVDSVTTGLRLRLRAPQDPTEIRDRKGARSQPAGASGGLARRRRARSKASCAVDAVAQDVRLGVRTLAAAPSFAAVAIITLALGIGANIAIFTVVDSVLLRPLPYEAPEELVRVARSSTRSSVVASSWPDFRDWREQIKAFSGLAAGTEYSSDFQWEGETRQVRGAVVTHDLFSVLGVKTMHGRTFTAEEDVPGGPRVVVLGHRLFLQRFGGDGAAVGRTMLLDGEPHTVIGVMLPGFAYPDADVDFWMPLRGDALLVAVGLPANSRTLGFIEVIGRLAPGVRLAEAQVEAAAVIRRIDEAEQPDQAAAIGISLTTLHEATVGDVRGALWLVSGSVGLVLAIACANVAGIQLSRAAARRDEFATRAALGATRARLVQQLLIESMLVACAGGVVGVLIGAGLMRGVLSLLPSWLPRSEQIGMSAWVFAFAGAVAVTSGMLAGLVPAWQASRCGPARPLGGAARGASAGQRSIGTQNLLATVQVGLAVVLLTGAALLSNSFVRLINVDPGFDPTGMVRAAITPSNRVDGVESTLVFYEEVLAAVRALPGVTAATLTYSPPFAHNDFRQTAVPEDEQEDPDDRRWVGTVIVGDRYFETVGIELRAGRLFETSDRRGGPPVAVINETMAARFWPDQSPVGKRFRTSGGVQGSADSFDSEFFPDEPFTVVGVVADVRRRQLSEAPVPEFYRPHRQMAWGSMYLLVRANAETPGLGGVIQRAIWDVDAAASIDRVGSVADWVSDTVAEPRFRALLLGGFSTLATILAMVGVYAVVAWGVVRRTREIGVRMALGARPAGVLCVVLRRGLSVAALGIGLGLAVAISATRLIAAMLFEVAPTDPATLGAVVALVAAVAALACYIPARRASRVDPIVALRAG